MMDEKVISYVNLANELAEAGLKIPTVPRDSQTVRVLIIGQPQQNLFGIVAPLLHGLEAFNHPMMRSYRTTITYGDSGMCTLSDGTKSVSATLEEAAGILTEYGKDNTPINIYIELNAPKLKGCIINIAASGADFEDLCWEELLTENDVLYFTLTATALLSMEERIVLRRHLLADAENILSIVLTNDGVLLKEERAEVNKALNKFLGGAVPIVYSSEIKGSSQEEIMGNMFEKADRLFFETTKRTEKFLLRNAGKAVALQCEILEKNQARLEETIEILTEKGKGLLECQESAKRRVRMRHISKMRLDATGHMAEFHRALTEKIHNEIGQGEDIEEMRQIVPSYISDQWQAENQCVEQGLKEAAENMWNDLIVLISKDIRNYMEEALGSQTTDYVYSLVEKYVKPDSLADFRADGNGFRFVKARSNTDLKRYGIIASGVALVLMSHPLLGAAMAVIGSHKVKQMDELRLRNINCQAMIEAADAMCQDIYNDMAVWLDGVIKSLEQDTAECMEDCYQKMMDNMIKALNERKRDHTDYGDQLAKLKALESAVKEKLLDYEYR